MEDYFSNFKCLQIFKWYLWKPVKTFSWFSILSQIKNNSKWNRTILIVNLETLSVFKKNFLNFIRPCANRIFNIHNPYGIKILTKLWLGLSNLHDHKFRPCFQDTLNPLRDCGNDTETTTHVSLHCPSFHTPRKTLLNNIRNINEQVLSHGKDQLIQTFRHGNPNCNLAVNRLILNATIEYLISTERFKCPLFN